MHHLASILVTLVITKSQETELQNTCSLNPKKEHVTFKVIRKYIEILRSFYS